MWFVRIDADGLNQKNKSYGDVRPVDGRPAPAPVNEETAHSRADQGSDQLDTPIQCLHPAKLFAWDATDKQDGCCRNKDPSSGTGDGPASDELPH